MTGYLKKKYRSRYLEKVIMLVYFTSEAEHTIDFDTNHQDSGVKKE